MGLINYSALLLCPLLLISLATSRRERKILLENTKNQTWAGWLGRVNSTSVLCRTPNYEIIFVEENLLQSRI
jgi:hypothetical protein